MKENKINVEKESDDFKVYKSCFDLTKAELEVFKLFLKDSNKEYDSEKISSLMVLDLSTIQRAVKKMSAYGLLIRNQYNLKSGGYYYSYKIQDMGTIRKNAIKIMDNRLQEICVKWSKVRNT